MKEENSVKNFFYFSSKLETDLKTGSCCIRLRNTGSRSTVAIAVIIMKELKWSGTVGSICVILVVGIRCD